MEMNKHRDKAIKQHYLLKGMKKGIPIALGYIPIAIAFGLLARSTGVPPYASILMSTLVFAGASQFMAINLLALNTGYWEVVLATFIINLRHFIMSAVISRRMKEDTPESWMGLIAFGITDETFSLASLSHQKRLDPSFMTGLNLVAYLAWVSGTGLGYFLGSGLPETIQSSMGIALYVMFIGLLVPGLKESRSKLFIVITAVGISSFLHWGPGLLNQLSSGWKIIIVTLIASFIGAVLFPEAGEGE